MLHNLCLNGGTCTPKGTSSFCECPPPYKGNTCEIDPCTLQPCKNGGTCEVDNNSFRCECQFPYTGKKCNAKCKCDKGTCELKDGNTVCVCPPEFGNVTISSCKACECGKDANCTFESTGWFSSKKTCICPKGYHEVKEKCVGMVQKLRVVSDYIIFN
ncbi:hypothetical protein NPIL_557601 [Nephila pilipes]|uniref:EGF-like domain-containing protein n=1 Tax=Nephila pilipes TaxID=299642 RepID=A0A8X6I7U9_NEPPI|nr:hypothetical protein NPIL_557601 [Nephila pilipes]